MRWNAWIGSVGALLFLVAPAVSQTTHSKGRDIPWRKEVGRSSVGKPQGTRLLPAPKEATENTASRRKQRADPDSAADPTDQSPDSRWWKEDAAQTVTNPEQGLRGRSVSPRGDIIQSSAILAMVGTEPILAGDLLGRINELLEPYKNQATEEQLEQQRWILMEKLLPSAVESKLVYLDFMRQMDKEKVETVRGNVYKQFDEKQLSKLVEQAHVTTAAELEERLRSLGSSLDNTRRAFFEQVAAREMVRRTTEDDSEVTHDDLLDYYDSHDEEYHVQARAKWEHLMVRFDRFPTKRDAYKALADMGNSVLNGAKLAEVARRASQGPSAVDGGQCDWTTRGSLVSSVLDGAIFSLPVGELSGILEDEMGFHIVRVTDREDEGKVDFFKAQVGIREKIKEERRDAKVKEYVERLKRETYVWNYFEDSLRLAERNRQR